MNINNFYVYELIDPRNELVFYVGKGKIIDKLGRIYRRIKDHLKYHDRSNKFKNNIIAKIKREGFEVRVNIVKRDISELEAFSLERELIQKYGRRDLGIGNLVNLTNGGEGASGKVLSKEAKENLSKKTKERIAKNGNPFKGKTHSEETKEYLSELRKGKNCGEKNPMFGKKHSEETKKRISEKQKGKSNMPKEFWYKFSNPGEKNPQAKKFIFINPDGQIFEVNGNFKGFVKEMKLSYDTCLNSVDKGKIPPPKNQNHNRMSQERLNTTGWEIKKNDLLLLS